MTHTRTGGGVDQTVYHAGQPFCITAGPVGDERGRVLRSLFQEKSPSYSTGWILLLVGKMGLIHLEQPSRDLDLPWSPVTTLIRMRVSVLHPFPQALGVSDEPEVPSAQPWHGRVGVSGCILQRWGEGGPSLREVRLKRVHLSFPDSLPSSLPSFLL